MEQHVRDDQPISIELVSTVHADASGLVDSLESSVQLEEWLILNRWRLPSAAIDPAPIDLDELRALRETLRSAFRARVEAEVPPAALVDELNRCGRPGPVHLAVDWSDEAPSAVEGSTGSPEEQLLGALARDGIDVVAGPRQSDLRSCEGPGCVLFFVRTHPRQSWCSPGCGNRARVARHYRKSRATD